MRKLGLSLLVAAATVATLGLSAARADDIIVGTAGPMTGGDAAFGEQMRRGAEMAIADINAAGGVLGKTLKLEVGDDACDPNQARSTAEDLVSRGVVFVAGHYCSSASIPASEVYAEAKVLQITPASTNPRLTDEAAAKGWTHVFRTCGRDDIQGAVAGKFLADKYTGKKVAIIHDKTTYGKGVADETKKAMNGAGLQEALYEAINKGDKDFSALVSKLKDANVDAVYLGLYHTEAGLLIRQAREQGLKSQFISEDAIVNQEFWTIAGDAAEGTLNTFGPDPRKFETAKAAVDKFKAQGYDPEGYTLYTYAAFQVYAQAVTKAGTTDVQKVAEVLRANSFDTVLGTLKFNEKGDIVNPVYVFYKWSKGTYTEVPNM
jgi:branched-chain amino acid transport system substrate-binding protein